MTAVLNMSHLGGLNIEQRQFLGQFLHHALVSKTPIQSFSKQEKAAVSAMLKAVRDTPLAGTIRSFLATCPAISKTKTPSVDLAIETKRVLAAILSKNARPHTLAMFAETSPAAQSRDTLQALGLSVVKGFYQKKIPIKHVASFQRYLNFYTFIAPLSVRFQTVSEALLPVIDYTLLAIHQLPSQDWLIKVLNQFPLPILQVMTTRIADYEQQSSHKKRHAFFTLFQTIQDYSKTNETTPLARALVL